MFCVSLFSPGVILYIYQNPLQLYFGGISMNADMLKAVYNLFFCCGDVGGRRLTYDRKRVVPFAFLLLSVLGICCGLSNITYIIPLCGLFG
jgi:hypothetical protein